MGSGSSTKKVNRQIQVPSASHRRARTPSPEITTTIESHYRRPYSSQPSPWLKKPTVHRHQPTSTLAQYASIWEQNGKVGIFFH